ncbi:MCE family protein [Nocardioides sp. GCM10030258]
MTIALGALLLVVVSFNAVREADTKHGVAYFDSFTSVYKNDKVRILGVEVGKIDKITATDDKVKVEFSYDAKYDLPAEVHAVIVSPTLVATRFVQLEPAYDGGPILEDGATIPMLRTASPLEFDDLKSELSRLSTSLGPNESDENGALGEFLDVAAKNGKGQGKRFNTMIKEFSSAMDTLATGKGDLFGAIRNLQVFVSAMASLDKGVAAFNRNLASAGDLLDDNGDELTAAIRSVDRAAVLVESFVKENRPGLTQATKRLASLTTMLANSRDELATVLHVGPNTLTNFLNIASPSMQAWTGGLMVDNLAAPGQLLCALVSQASGNAGTGLDACATYLAPLLNKLGIAAPPVGLGGALELPGGGGTLPAEPDEDNPYPNDSKSELPPSTDSLDLLGLLTGGKS